jgi:hypothetical protein
MTIIRLKNAKVSSRRHSTNEVLRRQDGKSGIISRLYQRSCKEEIKPDMFSRIPDGLFTSEPVSKSIIRNSRICE